MGAEGEGEFELGTVSKTVQIIEALQQTDGARMSELSDDLDMPASTVHNHLKTLEANEFVVNEGSIYRLSLRFLDIAESVRFARDWSDLAHTKVEELAEESGGRAHFIVEEFGYGVYLHTSTGEQGVKMFSRPGKTALLHVTAAGKAILATLPPSRVEQIIESHGLPAETERTITDPAELFDELETIRQQGYSLNREEHLEGVQAVGAPVTDESGQVLGAFSVSGPAHRLNVSEGNAEFVKTIQSICNEYELQLRY